MNTAKRKELMNEYKDKPVVGGVYCILCNGDQSRWMRSTPDLEGARNRFLFSTKINVAPEPAMLNAFRDYGSESFSFVVLEELKKSETQSAREFADDVRTLYELWLEKHESGELA